MVFSAFSVIASASVSSAQSQSASETAALKAPIPTVVVPGIGMCKTTLYNEDGTMATNKDGSEFAKWTVFNLCTDELLSNLWKIIPCALLSLLLQSDIGLTKVVKKYAPGMFKYAAHNPDGSSVENVKAIEYKYPLANYGEDEKEYFYRSLPIREYAEEYGEENIYVFNFAAFSNTYEEAAKLDEYIQMVKQQCHAEKVNLIPVSLGGTVASAYLDAYKQKGDVNKVINAVAALNGSDIFADIFAGKYAENSDELLYNGLLTEIAGEKTGYLINILLRLLPRKLARSIIDTAFDVILNTVVVNTPSLWVLVPADRYEELANKWLSDSEHAYLRTLTDRYHNAQANLSARVEELTEVYGIDIYNICGCDLEFGRGWTDYSYFRFFESSAGSNSDGIIQISSTGMGTDSCPSGTAYPSNHAPSGKLYCTNPEHNHISASINAATCYLPERTWYFVGQHHEIAYNDVAVGLICNIMLGKIDNIYSSEAYPQFNGTRFVKKLVRDYLPAAAEIDRSALSADQIEVLDAAIKKANEMLASTKADPVPCDEATKAMFDALVCCGVYEPEKERKLDSAATSFLGKISDFLFKIIGPRGFSDALFFRNYD